MDNPWEALPEHRPFVLPSDHEAIIRFNHTASEHHRIRLDIPPEPFGGRPDAPVVLLALNPGFGNADLDWYSRPALQAGLLNNARHRFARYPFYFLDPVFTGSGGDLWWTRKLRQLIEATSREAVAQSLSVVEFFGYKSHRYKSLGELLPSQEYAFHLVRTAIGRGAVIVIMRSARTWLDFVPELAGYDQLLRLKNPQNVSISPGNFATGWERVVDAVRI